MTRRLFVNRDRGAPVATELDGYVGCDMARVTISLVFVLVLALVGGCLFLAFGNFPVPSTPVERVLPDARFPK